MISFQNFNFRYEESKNFTLRGIDMTVRTGEFILLTGRSGCGKTTLIRSLNGLIPHFYPGEIKGDLLMDGHSLLQRGGRAFHRRVLGCHGRLCGPAPAQGRCRPSGRTSRRSLRPRPGSRPGVNASERRGPSKTSEEPDAWSRRCHLFARQCRTPCKEADTIWAYPRAHAAPHSPRRARRPPLSRSRACPTNC